MTDFAQGQMMYWKEYPTKKEQLDAFIEDKRDEKNANSPSTQDL